MINKRKKAVSPIIGVLLLLGVTVALFAVASNIFFSSIGVSASPQLELQITHTFDTGTLGYVSGEDAGVEVRIIRNENVDSMSYRIENPDRSVRDSDSFSSTDPGHIEEIAANEEETIVVFGKVGSQNFVLNTYKIPKEGI